MTSKAMVEPLNTKAWVLVPVEPTPAMVAAWMCDHRNWSARYAAMLSASPALPVQGGEVVATSWKYHDRECVDFKFAPDPYALERGFLTDIEPLVRQSALLAAESRVQSLEEEVKVLREALKPFGEYAPYVDMFVKGRAAQGGSPLLPTKHFRLSHFQAASAALKENGNV